jgi:WD40 repeat protein
MKQQYWRRPSRGPAAPRAIGPGGRLIAALPLAVALLAGPLGALLAGAPAGRAQPATAATSAPTAEPAASTKPFPMIEAGMHTALIRRIGVDRAGRFAVTASEDKTARLWDLQTGRQLAVLRPPIGPGAEGKLYAAALSPDGALVALGGYTSPEGQPEAIYLLDRASGRLLQRLPGLPSSVNHLAFSADGRWLAAALGAGGLRVIERGAGGRWQLLAADESFDRSSYSVAFAADGRLLAAEEMDPSSREPGELRLYAPPAGPRLALLQRRTPSGGVRPFFARFSPDGRRIAVGFADTTAVEIVDGATLAPIASADRQGLLSNGTLMTVAWSADGRRLLAAGSYGPTDDSPLVVWPAGGGPPRPVPLGMTNTVQDLQPLADGRLVFGGSGPAWGVLGPDLQPLRLANGQPLFHGPPVLDHRSLQGNFDAFRLAPDGRWLEFRAVSRSAAGSSSSLARFDLAERRLLFPQAPAPGGLAPRRSGLPIDGWEDTTRPTLAGKPLLPEGFDMSRSLALSADGSRFALGSEWYVRLFDRSGQRLWPKPASVPAPAWLVNLSADGRFVLAAHGDGSIRWYRSSDGSEALALFVHPDGRWLLWTPEGFYDASPATARSPGGASLLGYHLNQGREREATFISAAQLGQNFFRPDLIARRLAGDEAPIAAAVAKVGDVRDLLRASALPPRVEPDNSEGPAVRRLPSGEVELRFRLVDQGGGLGPIEITLNGEAIRGRQNLQGGGRPPVVVVAPRPGTTNQIKVAARDRGRSVLGQAWTVTIEAPAATRRPRLHLLAVGVSAYQNPELRSDVVYAANDARALAATFEAARGRLAGADLGTVTVLTDGDATRERVIAELKRLATAVEPGDRFVLHLAGHGAGFDGEYYFLTREVRDASEAAMQADALSGRRLRELLKDIRSSGGTLLLFDTCSSGTYNDQANLDLRASVRVFGTNDGRLILAAAGDRRMAKESADLRHGIFTGVVIDGLRGNADVVVRDGQIQSSELLAYVKGNVPLLTRRLNLGEQKPQSQEQGEDFPLNETAGAR